MAPEVRIEHRYPEALAFLRRHGPEALAVVHDLLAQSHRDDGQLVPRQATFARIEIARSSSLSV